MALVQTNPDAYTIKPEASAPAIDTSDWPLLLKNYSDCEHLELELHDLQANKFQCSFAHRTTLPSPRDARPLPVTSSSTSRPVSSTSTSPRIPLLTKSSHGSSACFGTKPNGSIKSIRRLTEMQC